MFNKREYINSYIKENYKTIKIRIKNDDIKVLNKLSEIDNINKYILDLINKDIMLNKKYNFINDNVIIDFEVSEIMKNLIKNAEEADLNNDYGRYMNYAYAIDTRAKRETGYHLIRESQWNKLVERYQL